MKLWGVFNQRKTDSKWGDIRLRKAVNYAINREELRRYGARGNAYNLSGHIPPGAFGHNPDLNLYGYDIKKARSLLAEAGYPNGFEINVMAMEAWKLEAQIMARMLERIGLKVDLEILTFPMFFRRMYLPLMDKPPEEQKWDIGIMHYYDIYGNPGATLLAFNLIKASDLSIEYDPVYEKMWAEMARTVKRQLQEKKIQQLEQYVYEKAFALFIYSPLTLYGVNKEVEFVPQKFGHLRLKETSLTENHWSIRGKNN
jgi:peptide/nickel transport system substrate-binding protein